MSILPITPRSPRTTGRRLEFSRQILLQIRMFLYFKNKVREDIFEEKGISTNFVKIKNPTMIQLNRIQ